MTLTNPIPPVDWIPLDGMAQQWTQMLCELEWPLPEALQASSAALHALALETNARRSYLHVKMVRTWKPPTPQLAEQHLAQAFTDLCEARRHWQAAGEWLERLARECRQEERSCYPLLYELFTALYTHQSYLCRLLARLAEELIPETAQVQLAMVRTLSIAFGVPMQEEPS